MSAEAPELVAARVDEWRRKLIDLSYRNRLINYKPTRASTIEIAAPSLETLLSDPDRRLPWRFYFPPEQDTIDEGDDRQSLFDELVLRAVAKSRVPDPDEIVAANETNPKKLNRIIENLARKSNAEYQDKALRVLYIAAGFLDWVDPTRDERLSSPLILVPVELKRMSASEPYQLFFVDDEEITINPSLTEKLRRDLNRDIPEDWVWEDKPVETELAEIERAISCTGWAIRRDAVLGLFSFQKFVMYRDLVANEAKVAQHPIIGSLARNEAILGPAGMDAQIPELHELDDVQPPEHEMSILDADATQRRCLEAARRGQSFVMHGPPGTGKSQTIANVIADSIGRGKRVLFVSEKAAALDVVHGRLTAHGLDEFCLLLHGSHASRREVVEELNRSLTGQLVPRPSMSSHELERLGQLRELLNQTAELIHLPMMSLGHRSLREVMGELARVHDALSVPSAPAASRSTGDAARTELGQLEEVFQRLAERWNVSPLAFAWRGYAGHGFTAEDRAQAVDRAQTFATRTAALIRLQNELAEALGLDPPERLDDGVHLAEILDHLASAPEVIDSWLDVEGPIAVRSAVTAARKAYDALVEAQRQVAADYPGRPLLGFDPDLRQRLEGAVKALEQRVGRTDAWENELLLAMSDIERALLEVETRLSELEPIVRELATMLGQPKTAVTVARASELASLGEIVFSSFDRPERDWLLPAGAERAREALEDVAPLVEKYRNERTRLLEHYTEDAFAIDAGELRRRFAEEYDSFFARLGSRYRGDARIVKSVRRDGRMPEDVISDLEAIREIQVLAAAIADRAERLSVSLGSYFRGVDTDPAAVARALDTGDRIRQLAASNTDLSVLAAAVSVSSEGDPAVAQLSSRVQAAVADVSTHLQQVRRFTLRAEDLFDRPAISELRATLVELRRDVRGLADGITQAVEGARATSSLREIEARLLRISQAHKLIREIEAAEPEWEKTLGPAYAGSDTDSDALTATADWITALQELVRPSDLPALLRDCLVEGVAAPHSRDLRMRQAALADALAALESLFESSRRDELEAELQKSPLRALESYAEQLVTHVDDLHDWTEFRRARDRARDRGWGPFVDALIVRNLRPEQVMPAFRRAFWNRQLEALFEDDPGLADRGSTYMRWIEEFKELDRKLVRSGTDRVIAGVNRHRGNMQVALPGSQVALLRREAAKQRRHMPVRALLERLPTLLGELKPCLMMSPLSVSHFLTAEHQFDLVIFDEASQVPPQDAINCIYRGQQLIVAGDSRQLPPTSFFQVAEAEGEWSEDDVDALVDMESILDVCTTILPEHPLRWHYRSHNEDLIAFSNRHVYDNLLVTFPSADSDSPDKGVHFIHVPDGIYERGSGKGFNRREAQIVAKRVFEHLESGRNSVGVITFNTAQEAAVNDELDLLRLERPEFEEQFSADRLDNVFVKNLESVQGDERNVILFSVGYGYDANRKFLMNFGPLNYEGGHRRLNVAVTRARELVEVISSVRSMDFRLTESSSRGARMLQEYIRYAEADGASAAGDARHQHQSADAAIEETIGDVVEELGYQPHFDVGTGSFRVDIGVRDDLPGGPFKLAIETDGASYRAIPTARDRERLRDKVLTDLNWRVHRVWSLDWVRNRQSEVERLEAALDDESGVIVWEDDSPHRRERTEREVADLLEALESGDLPWVATYERARLRAPATGYDFHESVNRDNQRELVIQLATVEAPLHIDRVMQELALAYGLFRVGDRVRSAAQQAINMAARKGLIELRGDFVWLPGQTLRHVRQPDWDDGATSRPIAQIPPEEIDLAIDKLVETASGSYDNLLTDVARVLGFDRVGPRIRAAVEERIRGRGA